MYANIVTNVLSWTKKFSWFLKIRNKARSLRLELDQTEPNSCRNSEVIHDKTLRGGTKAGKFHPLGKKTMDSCVTSCCDRPSCDVAYLLNGHCYAVQCTDSKLCQPSDHLKKGDTVQLAYMNKPEAADKKRGK